MALYNLQGTRLRSKCLGSSPKISLGVKTAASFIFCNLLKPAWSPCIFQAALCALLRSKGDEALCTLPHPQFWVSVMDCYFHIDQVIRLYYYG